MFEHLIQARFASRSRQLSSDCGTKRTYLDDLLFVCFRGQSGHGTPHGSDHLRRF